MRLVADAIGGVAKQPSPQTGMVAVPDDNQIKTVFTGETDNRLGRMTGTAFTFDFHFVLGGKFLDFPLPRFEIFLRGLGFFLEFAG